MSLDFESLLKTAKTAALAAGEDIIEIYRNGDFSIEAKSDSSPLTLADKAAHQRIVTFLDKTSIPVLSEEGRNIPFNERVKWEYFWMVDPLDGTKEFIKKNGEFTVNIALIHKNRPVLGVVYAPVLKDLYWAMEGKGSFKNEKSIGVSKFDMQDQNLKVVASRSHLNSDTSDFIARLAEPDLVSRGSSLKLLMIAEGSADLYPRYAPTMEWDTAAAHVIVTEAGGLVLQRDETEAVTYNKENLLNPHFLVKGAC